VNRTLAALGLSFVLATAAACSADSDPEPAKPDALSSGPEATMKAYLKASAAKDAAEICALFGTTEGPVRDDAETLKTCTAMYRSVLEVKPDQEGWADVSIIVAESTQALEDGPANSTLDGDLASFTYTALTEGKPVNLIRHAGEWFIKVD
jgi:hypothetical protein